MRQKQQTLFQDYNKQPAIYVDRKNNTNCKKRVGNRPSMYVINKNEV